jgi:predicted ATP-grasp superfamily ATP-dependent carboligase
MEAEWKRDPNNRTFKLLEINPRQSMQSSLPARCGMNLVLMAYLDTIGEAVRYPRSYAHEVGWVDFLGDFRSVLDTNTPIDDWLRSLRNVREWSFFAIDDLRPWIMSNAIAMKKIAQRCLGLAPRFRAGYPVTRAAFSHGSASPRGFPVAAR